MLEWRQPDFPALLDHRFGRAGHELTNVLDPFLPLRTLGAEMLDVANGVDQVAKDRVDAVAAGAFAEGEDHAREVA